MVPARLLIALEVFQLGVLCPIELPTGISPTGISPSGDFN